MVTDRPIYPMRVVLRRTGLSPDLLRAWERRYQVVAPGRTAGGQRLYSEADVERLTLLRRATLYGHAISQIAELENQELVRLLDQGRGGGSEVAPPPAGDAVQALRERCLDAVRWMDGALLDSLLRRAALNLGPLRFAEEVITPLVTDIGELWHRGDVRVVEEHLATSVIRQVVSGLMSFGYGAGEGPVLIAATTRSQHHEVGAMLAAAIGASRGWRAVYLGPDLPGEEIGLAAERTDASAIALSLVFPSDDPAVLDDLTQLSGTVRGRCPIYAGGPAADHFAADLERLGVTRLASLTDLGTRLGPAALPDGNGKAARPRAAV